MSARMIAAMREGCPIAVLAEVDHPEGRVWVWSGVGDLDHDGQIWRGVGILGTISPLEKTSEMTIQTVVFGLSGVSPEVVAFLDDSVRGREARAWLAAFDRRGRVIASPYLLVDGALDYQTLDYGDDGSATINLHAQCGFWTLERATDIAWTPEEQKKTYPTDVGLDLIPSLQNKPYTWSRT